MNTKRNGRKLKKFTVKMQAKLLLVFCILIMGLVGLIGRLIYLNRTDGEKYEKRVLSQQTYSSSVIPYQRGSIVDRKGTILATSQKVYNVILDVKKLLSDKEYAAPTITAITKSFANIAESDINEIIKTKPNSQYSILQKGLSYDEVAAFKELAEEDSNIQGVWFEEDFVRKYPYDTLGSSIIGFTISGNVGNWGLEQYYNEELNGINGREYGYIDEELKLERTVKPAVNGNTIVSTIDANVQRIVQNYIKSFNEEYGSTNIGVIAMDPNNGEILAMASNDEYDLNNPTDLTYAYTKKEIKAMSDEEKQNAMYQMWRNYAISDTYEPGSTFKPFTIAAALDENIIKQDETFFCDGYEYVNGSRIKCTGFRIGGHGNITLTEALMKSCNDALMQIAAKLGNKQFSRYQNFYGFGPKTSIDLPGEANGLLVNVDRMRADDLATSSFGQTFTNTMIQIAASYSSLVNGGYYYEPHMVKKIVNDKGATVKNIEKILVKETTTKATSDFINEAMYLTVEEGTAKGAQVPGYKVGGKTGTAQKLPRGNGKYLVSFLGAVPADKPEVVIYVVIDEAQNVLRQDDSSLATKLASKILAEILPFLEIYPTEDIEGEATATEANVPTLPSTNDSSNTDVPANGGVSSNTGEESNGGDSSNTGEASNGDDSTNTDDPSNDDETSTIDDGNDSSDGATDIEENEYQDEGEDFEAIPADNEND